MGTETFSEKWVSVPLPVVTSISIEKYFPGENAKPVVETDTEKRNITTVDTLMDLVRNLFPENIIQAAIEKVQTVSVYPGIAGPHQVYKDCCSTEVGCCTAPY